MNTKNSYLDKTLNGAAARGMITGQQRAYAKARGTTALAQMVGDGYATIEKIWANLSPIDQADILDEFGISAAGEGTSLFTPWIKLLWGEHDPDPKKEFRDSTGTMRQRWVPDRSMEVYHHTMEELQRLGVTADHAKVILAHGGAQSMAQKRKERLREEKRPTSADNGQEANAADEQTKRELFLRETTGQLIDVGIPLPTDAGEFVTVVCRQVEGRLQLLGVVNSDATAELGKLAGDRYADLLRAVEQRELEERIRAEASREAEQKLVEMDPDLIKRMYAKLQRTTAA